MHSKTDAIQSSADALRYPWENHPGHDQVVEVVPGVLWVRLKLPLRLNHVNIYLLADGDGVIALDARLRVVRTPGASRPRTARFAIQPYPAELAEAWSWQGRQLLVRPIRPEDEARHLAFARQLGDSVAVMDDGKVAHAGGMEAFAADSGLQQHLLGLGMDEHQ